MDKLFIGVLSGTSLDSIDVGIFSFHANNPTIHATLNHPLPKNFQDACLQASESGQCSIDQLGTLDQQAGTLFAEAISVLLKKNNITNSQIEAIGSHGQTIRHCPSIATPFTIQIGDPNIIVNNTGILTVADFRRRDIAAGGQGAPLAPAFHAAMFRSNKKSRIIVNIGGISNITVLNKDFEQPIIGFDSGPGNCLLDYWAQQHFNQPYDRDGNIALHGTPNTKLINTMLLDPYFQLPYPKSTGREYFNSKWLQQQLTSATITTQRAEDIQATLTHLTSIAISNAVSSIATHVLANKTQDIETYICGGGANNKAIISALQQQLKSKIHITTELGIAPEWVETGLFAWLAQQCLLGKPANIPTVTGAKKSVILGGIYCTQASQLSTIDNISNKATKADKEFSI